MTFTEVEDPGILELMGQSSGPRTRTRPHISDIYKSLNQELDPARFNDDDGPNLAKMEAGLLFETILEEALARKYGTVRPGEIEIDGFLGTPDGVNPEEEALEEFKCTWMSSRNGIVDLYDQPHEKFQHWFWQMAAYCHALEVRHAILTVFFVNGDYTHPYQPQLRRYRIEFSDEELIDNWQMLLRHAREKGIGNA